jgi:hypothetical protein
VINIECRTFASMAMNNIYIALLHHPVKNRNGDIVTTAVTNLDVHDIARAARTYGVKGFYIITPFEQQQEFAGKILNHWKCGYGAAYNPWRKKAFDIADVTDTLEHAIDKIKMREGTEKVITVATGASLEKRCIRHKELAEKISCDTDAYLFLFGTGWGIADDVLESADFFIEPIKGPSDYNHLSVRSAVSIILDRLFGKR